MTRPRALLSLAVCAFAAGMSSLAVLQQRAFETGRFDVGNLTQAVWSTAHGRFLEVTDLQGDQISRLGAHFDPLVALLAPLWWLWPSPDLLLVVQAVGVALGAVPVFLLARKHLGGDWAGPRLRARLPALPADAMARRRRLPPGRARDAAPARGDLVPRRGPPAALRALRGRGVPDEGAGRARRRDARHLARVRPRAAAGGLVIFVAGSARRGRRDGGHRPALRAGRRIAVRRALRRRRRLPGRHRQDGSSPTRCASSQAATEHRDLAISATCSPRSAACRCSHRSSRRAPCPSSRLNLLSSTPTQSSIHFHYTAGAIPGLIAGAVLGAARLRRRWPGAWPCGRPRPRRARPRRGIVARGRCRSGGTCRSARSSAPATTSSAAHDRAAARVLRAVPAGVAVSATNTLGAHLSERRRIFSFPVLREARWVAVDLTRPSYLDDATGKRFAAAVRPVPARRAVARRPGRGRRHRAPRRSRLTAGRQIGIVCGSR